VSLADVEDAIAEGVLNAVKYPPALPVKNPSAWLFFAARRCLSMLLQKRNGEMPLPLEDLTTVSDTTQQEVTDRTEDTYCLRMDLEKAFGKLQPGEQEIGVAYFRDGWTEQELAELNHVSQPTMHRTITRIESSLRESLAEYRETL